MDYLPSPRKGSGNAGANDLNSPGLVFRGRGGTPRTSSNPNGFEVQVDLETQQSAGGMGGSNGAGAGRVSAGSGASAGLPYMQQQQQYQEQQYQQPMQQQGMAPPEVCARSGGGRAWVEMYLCMPAWVIGQGLACHRAFPVCNITSFLYYVCMSCVVAAGRL